MTTDYDAHFYNDVDATAARSARVIAPIVQQLVRPRSVIDVGCGLGSWAAAFEELGVDDVWGVDGHSVEIGNLKIPAARFITADLSRPFELARTFDLVISLEVAEHLPIQNADSFIDALTGLGRVVLFSAAIPGQGGTHHVNEQWPEYWVGRFASRGFAVLDPVRRHVWRHRDVAWWYAQNCLLFASESALGERVELRRERELTQPDALALVHPSMYLNVAAPILAEQTVEASVPTGAAMLVAEHAGGDRRDFGNRRVSPFLERNGTYWGAPENDDHALGELERAIRGGAQFLAFPRPSFWWLDYFAAFAEHLRNDHRCIAENDSVVIFELAPHSSSGTTATCP